MKNLIFAFVLVLGFASFIEADSWALPTVEEYCSENKKYCLKVEPKKLESQLSYFGDKVDGKENAGADKKFKENYCKGTFSSKNKQIWKIQLDNEVSPVRALVSNDGNYVITFDNWHNVGYGDNVVAIYSGSDGRLIRKLGLTDFLTESDVNNLPASVSSIWWGDAKAHSIDYDKSELILNVDKPGENDGFFNVRIDLANGAVLDQVVDRIPSLDFVFTTKEIAEYKAQWQGADRKNECTSDEEIAELSPVDLAQKILQKELPEYPAAARAVQASGESVFEVVISKEGEVACINPVSGHPLLKAALVKAIRKWKFEKRDTKYKGNIIIEGKFIRTLNGKPIE